jgi:hypothetical protein
METNLTRSPSVRIKLGIKTWSTLAGMLFSLVMITGCNEETPPSNPPTTPGTTGGKMEPKKDAMAPTTPPPTATEKAKEPGK